ncbi:MAG: peptidoglycan editing factor PgeF [Desulfobulbaceae bacterium]|nr:peptidoglycan editing factor PgeF [Desulfobulbaceae bacterium]
MLTPLTSPALSKQPPVFHGIFNRHGGTSTPPFTSLNVSFGVGDDPENVLSNRKRIKQYLGAQILVSGQQVHKTSVLVVDSKPDQDQEIPGYDSFVSNVPGVGLMVQQADCQAVMLFAPKTKVVANIHCGWRGSVANIISKTMHTMEKTFFCKSTDLLAVISPSLGPCCGEFINFRDELPSHFYPYQVQPNFFDFWSISKAQLLDAGMRSGNIFTTPICTVCNTDWFSYRRDEITGRFCSIIGLKANQECAQ